VLVELWPIDRPKDYPKNARKWSAHAVERVAASIHEYGWRQPVVVDANDVIVIGHLRRAAGRFLGLTEVPVHVARDLTPAQIRGLRLADNRTNQEASWDEGLLALELLDLKDLDFNLGLTGFEDEELARLLAAQDASEGLTDEDAIPELPEAPISTAGDLWILGNHRLLVGDATVSADVAKLMAGPRADLVFTDPPYNVDYQGYTEDRLTIKGDRMSDTDFKKFLEAAFRSYRTVVKPGASMYVCHSSSWQREFQNALEAAGFEVRCQLIWSKNTFAWGFGRYKFQHEPLFYCYVAGQKDAWYGDKSQSTLWEEKKPAANRVHPTAKPVELVERALLNSSKAGDVVADLFGGSGSTLIACERRNRKARLMEIDPRYADCICRRYQEYAGKQAVLDGDGRTFEQIKAERMEVAA
jgi:DNA modification methylase